MILHVIKDEKFIDEARRVFEAVAPGQNEFIVVGPKRKFNYIKSFRPRIISPLEAASSTFLHSLRSYELILLHGMHPASQRIFRLAPDDVSFVWIGWGVDYYRLISPDFGQLLLPHTRRLYNLLLSCRWMDSILYWLHILPRVLLTPEMLRQPCDVPCGPRLPDLRFMQRVYNKHFRPVERELRHINRKVKYIAPVIYEDYRLLQEKVPNFTPSYVSWNYGNIARLIETLGALPASPAGGNILVGNSATFTNNHLEAFRILKRTTLTGHLIFCPLSYGRPEYGRIIRKEGERLFGPAFRPMETFMSPSRYWDILKSCSIVVMNHVRQQAVGNINAMLLLGAMVFLRKENSYYRFLKRQGATVFSVDDFDETLKRHGTVLSRAQITRNQRIIQHHFGPQAIRRKTRKLLEITGYFR